MGNSNVSVLPGEEELLKRLTDWWNEPKLTEAFRIIAEKCANKSTDSKTLCLCLLGSLCIIDLRFPGEIQSIIERNKAYIILILTGSQEVTLQIGKMFEMAVNGIDPFSGKRF